MKINNVTLMVSSNEREGHPVTGLTLLRIKKGQDMLENITLNQEMNLYSMKEFEVGKKINVKVTLGKLADNGDIKWVNGSNYSLTILENQGRKIAGCYHHITTTKVGKISLLYDGPGEYVVQGSYKTDEDARLTWDYFKVVEEE